MEIERWLPVPGHVGVYEVSDQGNVRRAWTRRPLAPCVHRGYRQVDLRGGQTALWRVGPLVLTTFVGPRPKGLECCHGNGVSTDDRLANLRWDTPAANTADAIRHGTHRSCKRSDRWMRTRTDALRAAIVERQLTFAELGKLAGVSPGFVSHLLPPASQPSRRPRKPGCSPDAAARIARALRRPVGDLFVELGPDDPSTGPLPVVQA